jgi:hypothetical protein
MVIGKRQKRQASHVWKLPGLTFCGAPFDPRIDTAIELEELRRRIHAYGKRAIEPKICATCYQAAWPPRRA